MKVKQRLSHTEAERIENQWPSNKSSVKVSLSGRKKIIHGNTELHEGMQQRW